MIEDFILELMNMYGLNKSDVVNLALEKYLITAGYLTPDTLKFVNSISELDKKILQEGLI